MLFAAFRQSPEPRDFSLAAYQQLLDSLQEGGFQFATVAAYFRSRPRQAILLRHDVDERRRHALEFARIQHRRGIRGTYYFRIVPQSFDEEIIREIHGMGHEIGYHYEDMDFARGNPHRAILSFERHLDRLRQAAPVSTICMHGSPRSPYDNKDLWRYYDYRDYGILGEPYFDIDFRSMFYLTDTGRRWNAREVSVRDKVEDHFDLTIRSTHEIIQHIRSRRFPRAAMFNFHPQRWTDSYSLWLREKYTQRLKNEVKYWLIKWKERRPARKAASVFHSPPGEHK